MGAARAGTNVHVLTAVGSREGGPLALGTLDLTRGNHLFLVIQKKQGIGDNKTPE